MYLFSTLRPLGLLAVHTHNFSIKSEVLCSWRCVSEYMEARVTWAPFGVGLSGPGHRRRGFRLLLTRVRAFPSM